jgi:hypothetical protein
MNARVLRLLIGLLPFTAVPLQAQEHNDAVTRSCLPQEGVLVIRYYPSLAEAPDPK